ncbi:finger 512 isoform X1 [Podarcis lilfordi]|uniref:Zinc finger protein 512 n=1 Tax=Podarcis lilfordi TaxID=74358 RepID=A0AA35VYH0_9SAUR|nr:finger 512 isoform X1 [Podarcis lilfordi]
MKGAKPAAAKTPGREEGAREAGDSLSKAKHKQENKDAGDDKDLPQKKQKSGKWQQMGQQPHLKPKGGHRKRDTPVYAAGSLEEHWQLEILSRGRVTCPTCRAVVRKTVEGLKKHMTNCQHEMLTCHRCGKQLRSLAGMKYHIMADHNSLPVGTEEAACDLGERERLRRVLKRMGKLKCPRQVRWSSLWPSGEPEQPGPGWGRGLRPPQAPLGECRADSPPSSWWWRGDAEAPPPPPSWLPSFLGACAPLCPPLLPQGCTGSFTSVLGFLYHTRKCGKEAAELEQMALKCQHCGKAYRSKAGLAYHLKMEHGPISLLGQDIQPPPPKEVASAEPSSGGRRALRKSALAAAHHLQEALAKEALAKEWPRRKVWQDLVPEDRKLKYTRPGLPAVSQEVLSKWRAEIKACRRVRCPNQGCECVYSSISGLKSHLSSCILGEFVAGRYRCLLCEKEFVSESGVKYHINTVHAQDWFAVGTHTARSCKKLLKQQPEEAEQKRAPRKPPPSGSRKKRPQAAASPKKATPRQEAVGEQGQQHPLKASCPQQAGSGSCEEEEEEDGPPALKLSHRRGRE